MTHSLPLTIADALNELPASERDGLRRQAARAALEKLTNQERALIEHTAKEMARLAPKKFTITESGAVEVLAAIGAVLAHGNTGRMFNAPRTQKGRFGNG